MHLLYLFSSGICTANICRGSTHWTTQPCLSLTLAVSTLRKVLGMRLHSTALMVCTSSRGGHWGTGFLCSLLKMADDRGIAFWTGRNRHGRSDNRDVIISVCISHSEQHNPITLSKKHSHSLSESYLSCLLRQCYLSCLVTQSSFFFLV